MSTTEGTNLPPGAPTTGPAPGGSSAPVGGSVQGTVENEGAGERWGKVVGPDIDKSFHAEVFTDPKTGEVIETVYPVHDVPVKNNADGSVETAKMSDQFVTAETGGVPKSVSPEEPDQPDEPQPDEPSGGEGGETTQPSSEPAP
jgi:hypothetical protein